MFLITIFCFHCQPGLKPQNNGLEGFLLSANTYRNKSIFSIVLGVYDLRRLEFSKKKYGFLINP